MSVEKNKEEEEQVLSEKIDESQLALEYLNKDKEKLKPNKNDFNKISYIEYADLFKKIKPELDFLYDYSKVLGPENNDPKTIQWQLFNLDRLFKYGIDISVLKRRNKEQSSGHFKMSNVLENISYRLQKHGRLAPSIDIARDLPKRSEEEQYQINEEEEDEEDINIENEDINNGDSQSYNFKKNEDPNNTNNNNINNNNININNENDNINNIMLNDQNNINDNNPINNDNNNINNINNDNGISVINLNKKSNNPNGYNGYEDNFYDKNDPFIDDELDNTSEDNELLYKLSLEPGNYTEQEILNNHKKNMRKLSRTSTKKKKKIKNAKGKRDKEKEKDKKGKTKKLKLSNKLLSNKTKRKNNEENNKDVNNKKKKKMSLDSITDFSLEKIQNIFDQMISEYDSEVTTDHEKESFLRRNIKIIEEIYKKNQSDCILVLSQKLNIEIEKAIILIEYELFKTVLENKYSNFSKFLNKLYSVLKENGIREINSLSQLKNFMTSVPEIEKSLNHVVDNILCYRDKFNSYMGKHYLDMYIINDLLECYIPNIKERNNEYIIKMSTKLMEYEEKFKIIIPKDIIASYIKEKNPNIDFTEDLNTDINNRRFSLESFIFFSIGQNVPVYNQDNQKISDNNEKDNSNCIVAVDAEEILNVKKNDMNLGNNSINIIKQEEVGPAQPVQNIHHNDNRIFQSYKSYENRLAGIQKLFTSKIEYKDNNIDQCIQTEDKK